MTDHKSNKKTDKTFELIKTLGKSEKRFFKIFAGRHVIGEENNYVLLFDAMDKLDSYNEQEIKNRYSDKKFTNRMAVAKAYLHDLILKAMAVYHQQNSIDSQVYELLKQIRFLFDKGLVLQAETLLQKAFKIVEENELPELKLELINWQKRIIESKAYQISEEDLKRLYVKENKLIQNLELINQFWELQSRLYIQHNNKGIIRNTDDLNAVESVFNAQFMQSDERRLPFRARLLKQKIYATYFFQIRDFQSCYTHISNMVNLIESKDRINDVASKEYVESISNLLNITYVLKKDDETGHYLGKLRNMYHNKDKYKSESVRTRIIEAWHYHSMNYIMNKGLFQEGIEHVNIFSADLKKYGNKMNQQSRAMLFFMCFHICYSGEAYKDALEWLNNILAIDAHLVRKDIRDFTRILKPIVLSETTQNGVLQKSIISLYKHLMYKDHRSAFEDLAVNFIEDLASMKSKTELKDIYSKAKNKLKEIMNDPYERKALEYFKFDEWLNCKIENKVYGEAVLQRGALA